MGGLRRIFERQQRRNPFGLSLSKPRFFLDGKNSPSTSSGRTETYKTSLSRNATARANTASNISAVNRPVFWLYRLQ
jgi:hypothetical protein